MCQKVKYNSRAEALKDVIFIRTSTQRFSRKFKSARKINQKLSPYECRVCGFWHLTTQRKRKYSHG